MIQDVYEETRNDPAFIMAMREGAFFSIAEVIAADLIFAITVGAYSLDLGMNEW